MTDPKHLRRVRVASTVVGLLLLKAQVAAIFFKLNGGLEASWWLVWSPTLGLPVLIFVGFISVAIAGAALSAWKDRRDSRPVRRHR